MRSSQGLVLASLNGSKQAEFQALFAPHKIPLAPFESFVRNASFLATVESMAPSATYYENAFRKCHAAFQACKLPTFADDSGLEIGALGGEPGVHSAHFGKPSARESQDAANRRQILERLKGKGADRNARMRCVLVFMVEGVVLRAESICEGKIAEKETGTNGFGYDPIFIPNVSNGKTLAELSAEEKNKVSHRALAVNELVRLMQEREIQLVRP
jgi:XTP/dITP diphosphohydrolase